ncbi:hypothetical protein DFS34DRAFT_654663 [Phlyctochytrium arcticum]|nr:hypothetical protein DFS34DRAFT_654663 [Phlyctochytrium arcticum]
MPNFYVTRKVGRLKNLINPAIPPAQATTIVNHLKAAARDLSAAVFDAYNLLAIHHQPPVPGGILVPQNLALEGCRSDQTFFRNVLLQSIGQNPRQNNPFLSASYDNFLRPAMTTGYVPTVPPAAPTAPVAGAPLVYTRPVYTHGFNQLFSIEARKIKNAFCRLVVSGLPKHLEQTLLHYLEHSNTIGATLVTRNELVRRTICLLEPLYLLSSELFGVGQHSVSVGNPLLFAGLLDFADPNAQQNYVEFLQPIVELCLWAAQNIALDHVHDPTMAVANTFDAMSGELRGSGWQWVRLIKTSNARAHFLLPLLQYLSECAHRPQHIPGQRPPPRTLKHVKLSPERTSRGPDYAQFDFRALCETLGHRMRDNPIFASVLGQDGQQPLLPAITTQCTRHPAARLDLIAQIFNIGKVKSLRQIVPGAAWTFRNQGISMPFDKMGILTNGDNTMLGFEVQPPANFHRRIPTIEELKDRDHAAHAEHRIVQNPDQAGGALHQLNRRPILPAARVLVLPGPAVPSPYGPTATVPHTRPVIGIDFGQRFQAVAVRDNLASLANATGNTLQTNPHQQAQLRQLHKDRRREAITRVRGRQYRELDKSAWFERKDAIRRSLETQRRADALWGAGVTQAINYLSNAYAQLDQIRNHFFSSFHYRASVTRSSYQERALDLTARSLLYPTQLNARGQTPAKVLEQIGFRRDPNTNQMLSRPTHRQQTLPPIIRPAAPAPIAPSSPSLARCMAVHGVTVVMMPEKGTTAADSARLVLYEELVVGIPAWGIPAGTRKLDAGATTPLLQDKVVCTTHRKKYVWRADHIGGHRIRQYCVDLDGILRHPTSSCPNRFVRHNQPNGRLRVSVGTNNNPPFPSVFSQNPCIHDRDINAAMEMGHSLWHYSTFGGARLPWNLPDHFNYPTLQKWYVELSSDSSL